MKLEIVNSNDTSKEDVLQLRLIHENEALEIYKDYKDGKYIGSKGEQDETRNQDV